MAVKIKYIAAAALIAVASLLLGSCELDESYITYEEENSIVDFEDLLDETYVTYQEESDFVDISERPEESSVEAEITYEPQTCEDTEAATEKQTSAPIVTEEYVTEQIKYETETETVYIPPSAPSEQMVWIPTNGGKKYHARSTCSQMEDPDYVTLSEAISLGFTKCKRKGCW